ncbi:MAG: hypothetical protein QOI62_3970 [Solirubrobacteraceae bacterium]|nr:hypothetical protein [Solirubrobacteraceae bacterium]
MLRRCASPLLAALACLLGLALVAVLGLAVPAVRFRDAAVLHGFVALDRPSITPVIELIAHLADPVPYACAGLACVGVALTRGRRWRALAVVALLGLTGATTQLLKHVLAEPRVLGWTRHQLDATAFPSGHATAAMTLALCAVLVAPAAMRAATALAGGAFAVAVGYAVLVLKWHFPSDVIGGFLVAGLWAALALAALRAVERDVPELARGPGWRQTAYAASVGGVVAAIAAALVGARSDVLAMYAMGRPMLVAAALTIAVLALVLVTGVGAASAPRPPAAR